MDKYLEIKEKLEQHISEHFAEAVALNDDLADNPEISGEEYETSKKIVKLLEKNGFRVETEFAGFPTAFKGVYGEGGHKYKIAILTEYDALPEVGHACGHCVSGSISVLAALASAALQDELDCDIHIIGTPAEETDGAKCSMSENGIFDEYDMAMMIHMYDKNMLHLKLFALKSYLYTFHGKASHAAAAPWDGVNALNAATLMTMAIDMKRQQCTPDVRFHYVYKNGGAACNVIPEEAAIEVYARALSRTYLRKLLDDLDRIAEGAALMTGTTWDKVPTSDEYDNMLNVPEGIKAMTEVWDEISIENNGDYEPIFGSSDVGNVSFVCPTFHPTLQIVDRGVAIHTREFEAAVKSDRAHEAIRKGAEMIGLQIAKIFTDEERAKKLREESDALEK